MMDPKLEISPEARLAAQHKGGAAKTKKVRKRTLAVKDSIVLVFEKLGGVKGYARWAAKNPDKFYEHYIKVLPIQVKAEVNVTNDFAEILEAARLRGSNEPVAVVEAGAAIIAKAALETITMEHHDDLRDEITAQREDQA